MNWRRQKIDSAHKNGVDEDIQKFKRKYLVFGAVIILLAVLSGVMLYNSIKGERITQLRERHEEQITLAAIDINRELGDIGNTVRLLSTDSDILSSLSPFNQLNTLRLKTIFKQFGRAIDNLLQIRWLDDTGHEQVRINIVDGKVHAEPAEMLQDKSNRYYFQNAMKVFPPEIYISPIDLNIEHGEIVKPLQPVFRIGLQTTATKGMRRGLLMINYDLTHLIKKIRSLSSGETEVMWVDAWGNWLLHPDPSLEWGAILGKSKNSLTQLDPLLWAKINSGENQIIMPHNGELISTRHIALSFTEAPTVAESIYMLVRTPKKVMEEIEWNAIKPTLLLVIGILLIGGRILWRDYTMQQSLQKMTLRLACEKNELKFLNSELDNALSKQQLLQNELVETRKLSSLGMMVAGVAHELNTPIGGAIMAESTLQSSHDSLKKALDEGLSRQAFDNYISNTEEGLKLVESNLTRAAALVKSFKRLALDRANDEIVSFNLDQVVSDLIYTLTPKLKNSGTRIVNEVNTELMLAGYPGIVSQILQNLIINALTYGTEGMQQGEIIVQAELNEEWVVLSVSDNGKGIPPELRESLFDPFVTSGRGLGHTGLGLHLVHQWVTNLMHGQIKMESLSRGGTRFVIYLPKNIQSNQS
ncbi:sensor histidine kinase [Neptuniibacter sp. 1_MG-2023]|uniref:sensor histidine kinase n=1 Tax=Neptuniibacter sp. 1_MG-2023 TaxID=3062662 RepID=UPI0026E41261|nr:sensor histidine kinase [Neptuniibacter sp. 1_MG-2023]MDO6594438.1 sensor histidine kinase [Neptuniibacter sp. 1_MG-2023]